MICRKCNQDKPESAFDIHSRYRGKVYLKKICSHCDYLRGKATREKNSEQQIAYRKSIQRWHEEHRDERNRQARERRVLNIENALKKEAARREKSRESFREASRRYGERHREECRKRSRDYQRRNLEIFKMHARERRELLRKCTLHHTDEQWRELLKRYIACPSCHRKWNEKIKPTRDHIIPLTAGGNDNIENIQPLCLTCNVRKHNKLVFDSPAQFVS
jgi:hypothetical protein